MIKIIQNDVDTLRMAVQICPDIEIRDDALKILDAWQSGILTSEAPRKQTIECDPYLSTAVLV